MIERAAGIYNGLIYIEEQKYMFTAAKPEDSAEIAEIYKGTKIDLTNYKIRLDTSNENNFMNKGGMFVVLNEEEIKREICSEKNLWAVIKNSSGQIEGSFWYSEENEGFCGTVYDDKKYIYPREIVTAKNHSMKYAGRILYYTIIEAMRKCGIKYGVCDVYKVKSYKAEGKEVKTELLNIPSSRLLESISAEFKGAGRERYINLSGLEVTIEPQIYFLDHDKICGSCREYFREKPVQIIWR